MWWWSTSGSNEEGLTAAVTAFRLQGGGERDGGRKMKGGERQVWWSGKAECWRERRVHCHLCECVCFYVCVCEPCLCEFWGFACFLKRDSSLSLCLYSPPPLLCFPLSLLLSCSVALPCNPLPPGLVEQWADMSLFLCKSNWRQAFIGMTWRWVAKSFQPSCLRLTSLRSRTVLHTDTAAAAAQAG